MVDVVSMWTLNLLELLMMDLSPHYTTNPYALHYQFLHLFGLGPFYAATKILGNADENEKMNLNFFKYFNTSYTYFY